MVCVRRPWGRHACGEHAHATSTHNTERHTLSDTQRRGAHSDGRVRVLLAGKNKARWHALGHAAPAVFILCVARVALVAAPRHMSTVGRWQVGRSHTLTLSVNNEGRQPDLSPTAATAARGSALSSDWLLPLKASVVWFSSSTPVCTAIACRSCITVALPGSDISYLVPAVHNTAWGNVGTRHEC